MSAKNIKEAASLVGAIAGIVVGLDKIKTTLQKWKSEYDKSITDETEKKVVPPNK